MEVDRKKEGKKEIRRIGKRKVERREWKWRGRKREMKNGKGR